MKILLVNALYFPNQVGGAERSVKLLAEYLTSLGHEVVVVSTVSKELEKIAFVNEVKVYYVGIKNLYWQYGELLNQPKAAEKIIWYAIDTYNMAMATVVKSVLKAEKPDLVHTNNLAGFSVSVWKTVRDLKIPLVHTVRDYYLMCPRKALMFRNNQNCETQCFDCKLYSLSKIGLSNLPDAAVGISHSILNRHLKMGYFSKVPSKVVIHNSCYRPTSNSLKKTRSNGDIVFGYLGRLDTSKGIDVLFRCLDSLPPTGWKLNIGGPVSSSKIDCYKETYRLNNVNFLGYVDPEKFFPQIDFLIVPSMWQEPFGRIIIEAYAHNVPVIGSNRGGIPELIEEGVSGYIFDADRPQSLVKILNDLIDKKSISALDNHLLSEKSKHFSIDFIGEQYLALYKEVA